MGLFSTAVATPVINRRTYSKIHTVKIVPHNPLFVKSKLLEYWIVKLTKIVRINAMRIANYVFLFWHLSKQPP